MAVFNSGVRGKRAKDGVGIVGTASQFVQQEAPIPAISGYTISGVDDTALNPTGGQTVIVNGSGFVSGLTVLVGTTSIGAVTVLSPNRISFTSPALSSGSYTLLIANSSGSAAVLVPGLTYSSIPTFTTGAGSIGSFYETTALNANVSATSDSSLTYSLASGSLPSGATLYANGVISGTTPVDSASTTYNFSITATDAELQDVTRSFTLTTNVDVVSWATPASEANYILSGGIAMPNVALSATSAAGYNVSYSANALPTGVSLSGNTISGTPTVQENITTLLTATAATTNRTATRTVSWTVNLGDTYWKNVSLLLSSNTSTTTFNNDASFNNNQLTIVGDTKPNNFNPYEEGYYSNYFDGSGDYLQVPASATALDLGAGDFTVEFWLYVPGSWTSGGGAIMGKKLSDSTAGWQVYRDGGTPSKMNFRLGSQNNFFSGSTPASNIWEHWALVRTGTTLNLYKNGVLDATGTSSVNISDPTGSFNIGFADTWSVYGNYYFSNVRIVKGLSVYTGNFTVPTGPLSATQTANPFGGSNTAAITTQTSLLTCQSNRFIDNSTNNFAITKNGDVAVSSIIPFAANSSYASYGSAYFDGTGDTLFAPASVVNNLSGTWTVEAWCYMAVAPTGNTYATSFPILSTQDSAGTTSGHYWGIGSTAFVCMDRTASTYDTITGTMPSANRWFHFATTNVGTTINVFIDGVLVGTKTQSAGTWDTTLAPTRTAIGSLLIYNYARGYIADLRIINGTALYTTTFTPPTTLLTATTNTQLLALQYNGGANNNGFVDQSSFNNVVTRVGNATQGTFSPYSQTGWSTYYNGTTDYQALATNAAFAIGTADFTVEAWVYPATTNQRWSTIFAGVNYGNSSDWGLYAGDGTTALYPMFFFTSASTPGSGTGSTQGNFSLTSYTALVVGTWSHIAVSRVSGTAKMFINGVQVGVSVTATAWSLANTLQKAIGGGYNGNSNTLFTGYISNLRVISGAGLYSETFTPPTTPLSPTSTTILLTNQTNRFIDNSKNNFTLTVGGTPSVQALSPFGGTTSVPTSYSVYFDGNGDKMSLTGNSASALAGGNWTIEAWFFLSSTNTETYPHILKDMSPAYGQLLILNGSDNSNKRVVCQFQSSGNAEGPSFVTTDTWNHVAAVRNGTQITVYLNGVPGTPVTGDTSGSSPSWVVGWDGFPTSTRYFNGYISNVRVTKGQALYTGNFTPSTAPLTTTSVGASGANVAASLTGTVAMLLCNSSTNIDNSVNNYTITTEGDTKPRTFNPFGNTLTTQVAYSPNVNGGSIYFDGTGDYLSVANNASHNSFSGNFTVEGWFYFNTVSGTQLLFSHRNAASGAGGYVPFLIWSASGTLTLYVSGNNSSWDTVNGASIGTVVPGQWYHFVYTRSGSTVRIFLNGVQTYTFTSSTSFSSVQPFQIGMSGPSETNTPMNGYVSDVRITKAALYTTPFVPPVAPLTIMPTVGTASYTSTLLVNGTSGGIIDAHSSNNLETFGNTQLAPEDPYSGRYYSNYFDGSGDYFTLPVSANLAFSADFTIECWVYLNSVSGLQGVYSSIDNAGDTWAGVYLGFSGTSFLATSYISSADVITHQTTVVAGQWYHIAIVRNGSSTKSYLNGVQSTGTTSGTYSLTQSGGTIGSAYPGTSPLNGYISNLRVVKGTAVYTSGFTPSTAPLTSIAGTQLLTCQSSKFVDNSTNSLTMTVAGNVAVKSRNPFQQNTGKSLYFDGQDYIAGKLDDPKFGFGTANFTIECWIYPTATDSYIFLDTRRQAETKLNLGLTNSGNGLNVSLGTSAVITATTGVGLNKWTHVAVVKNNGTYTLYLDGVTAGTVSNSTDLGATGSLVLGTAGDARGNDAYDYSGYLSDLRITKGVARYTTTFTPPATPLVLK